MAWSSNLLVVLNLRRLDGGEQAVEFGLGRVADGEDGEDRFAGGELDLGWFAGGEADQRGGERDRNSCLAPLPAEAYAGRQA